MRKFDSDRRKAVVSLAPLNLPVNRYVDLFSKAISDQKYIIREFRWRPTSLWKTHVAILHWPNEFFTTDGRWATVKSIIKLAAMRLSQFLWRTRFIWVAHNAVPHETKKCVPRLTRSFLRSVDGIIFLSARSRELIGDLYPESRRRHSLVTVMGHYRDTAVKPLTPSTIFNGDVKLVAIGLVRPYKNLEVLVDAATEVSGIRLLISGVVMDPDRWLGEALRARARKGRHITLDLRDTPIDDANYETIVDSADAVVAPYRNILNSSAALFALSRNRPLLAPNIGSLPELRGTVGSEWVYLYDGEFNQGVLVDFLAWLRRTKRGPVAPLDAYSWSRIGIDLGEFIELTRHA